MMVVVSSLPLRFVVIFPRLFLRKNSRMRCTTPVCALTAMIKHGMIFIIQYVQTITADNMAATVHKYGAGASLFFKNLSPRLEIPRCLSLCINNITTKYHRYVPPPLGPVVIPTVATHTGAHPTPTAIATGLEVAG